MERVGVGAPPHIALSRGQSAVFAALLVSKRFMPSFADLGLSQPLLEALHRLQQAAGTDVPMRLRTALVTARSAPAHERAVRTLMQWNIDIDEAMFLGGLDKGEFLRAYEPDFFFDDQRRHVESARKHVATGHVPFGVSNLERKAS